MLLNSQRLHVLIDVQVCVIVGLFCYCVGLFYVIVGLFLLLCRSLISDSTALLLLCRTFAIVVGLSYAGLSSVGTKHTNLVTQFSQLCVAFSQLCVMQASLV